MKIAVTIDKNTVGNYEITKCEKVKVELAEFGDPQTSGGPEIWISFFSADNQIPRRAELHLQRDDAVRLAYSVLAAAINTKEVREFTIS
jgi:hypothetical protein